MKDKLSEFKKMELLIKKTKDDKLLYAFYNFYDKEINSFRNEIDKASKSIEESQLANEKSYLNTTKSLQEIHDLKIETKLEREKTNNHIEKIKSETYKQIEQATEKYKTEILNKLYWNLSVLESAIINRPRLLGLFLLIRGNAMINDFKKAKIPEIEFVKFQGRLDTDFKRISKQQNLRSEK